MKLFSPTQAKQASVKNHEDEIFQIAYLTASLGKLQDAHNKEEANFSKRLEEQQILYTEEKEKLQQEVRLLEGRRIQEESRLRELLIPIDGLKEQAQKLLISAEQKEKEVEQEKQEIDGLKELYTNKLDELGERSLNLSFTEQKIEMKLKGIEEESKMVSELHRAVSSEIDLQRVEHQKRTKVLLEREKAIEAKISLNMAYLEERTLELNQKETLLNDRLKMVERDLKRINK